MVERYVRVLAMRAEGKTFREIAEEFGVGRSRAQQLYRQAKESQVHGEGEGYIGDDEPLSRLGLKTRYCSALSNVDIKTVGQALEMLKGKTNRRIRNFGPMAREELVEKLLAHGRLPG